MKLIEWFKKQKVNTLLIIGMIVLAFLMLQQCNSKQNYQEELHIQTQNTMALNDSVRTYTDKNKNLVFEKNTLIASEKELKELNKELYDEVKTLKDNPVIIIRPEIQIEHDTVTLTSTLIEYADGTYGIEWVHDTTYTPNASRTLAGESFFKLDSLQITPLYTVISEDKIKFNLSTGITEKKDFFEIFIKSDYPGFEVIELDGAILDKKRFLKHQPSFIFGPYLGAGLNFSNGGVNYGIQVGFGVTYNLNKQVRKIFKPF